MMSVLTECSCSRRTTNFVITGQARCGASILQTSIDLHPQVVCHGDLLHEDEKIRKALCKRYWENNDAFQCWNDDGYISPEQYLNTRVFDHSLYGETTVGVKLLYPQLEKYYLWEYCHERCLEGDFCTIHVRRNPVACYVSLRQAQETNVWGQSIYDCTQHGIPFPVNLLNEIPDLTKFVNNHLAHQRKVEQMCDDRLEIDYIELVIDYHNVMLAIFDFLELPPVRTFPLVRRLKNYSMRSRILNFEQVCNAVSKEIRRYLEADDLF